MKMEEVEKSRLEQFKEFVEMDPTDSFSRYALGMEYMGISQFQEALEQFDEVIRIAPNESAAYFQASIASSNLDRKDGAREYLKRGISIAEKTNDKHARDEMQAALEKLDEET
jgi:tetratricopeptide (TPR) repeat protein